MAFIDCIFDGNRETFKFKKMNECKNCRFFRVTKTHNIYIWGECDNPVSAFLNDEIRDIFGCSSYVPKIDPNIADRYHRKEPHTNE